MFQKLEANIPRLGDSTEAPAEHWHATEVPIGSLVECRAQAPFGYKHEFSWQCYVQDIHLCVVSAGHGVSLGSYEYLVYEKVFVAVAAEFGLQPVTSYAADTEGFQAQYHDQRPLHDLLQQDTGPLFRHFKPQFPFTTDTSLTKASKLNCTFVFQKVAAPPTQLPHPIVLQPEGKRSAPEVERQEAEGTSAKGLKTGEGENQEAESASVKRPRTAEEDTEEAEDAPAKRLKPAD
ncbi:hypothetical protein ABBQ38_014301 [Trebouxia sp. C0009 RCD-2024]